MGLKKLALGAVAFAVLGLPLVVAAPATAATLPSTDSLYAITCEVGPQSLYGVDADSAELTYIGDTSVVSTACAGPGAFDRSTGTAYFVNWLGIDGELTTIDLATGATSSLQFTGDFTGAPEGLAIAPDGSAWITAGSSLYTLDLSTGVTALVGAMTDTCLYALSVDPSTSILYGIHCGSHVAYQIDPATATLTEIGQFDNLADTVLALAIDSSGRWWIQSNLEPDVGPGSSSLFSSPLPADLTSAEFEGPFVDYVNEQDPYIESILIAYTPAPVLPATGAEVVPVAAGMLALLAAGAVLLVAARRRDA